MKGMKFDLSLESRLAQKEEELCWSLTLKVSQSAVGRPELIAEEKDYVRKQWLRRKWGGEKVMQLSFSSSLQIENKSFSNLLCSPRRLHYRRKKEEVCLDFFPLSLFLSLSLSYSLSFSLWKLDLTNNYTRRPLRFCLRYICYRRCSFSLAREKKGKFLENWFPPVFVFPRSSSRSAKWRKRRKGRVEREDIIRQE